MLDEAGARLTRRRGGRLLVPRGEVSLVVDAWDHIDGNLPRSRLGLYSLAFQRLHADAMPVAGFEPPRPAIEFARLPGADQVKTVYSDKSGITVQGSAEMHFRYSVAASLAATTALPAGDYLLRMVAKDFPGNAATRGRDLSVRVY